MIPPPHPSPQAQALVVALLATAIALGVEQDFIPSHILFLVSSSACIEVRVRGGEPLEYVGLDYNLC